MIEITCQLKEMVEKLTVLSKVKLVSKKSLAPISVRVDDKTNLCELCLCFDFDYNQYSTYIDYYAYLNNVKCEGSGVFVIPSFMELLNILKTIGQNDYIAIRFDDKKVTVLYGDDVIFKGDSNIPDDSYIQMLNTFELNKEIQLPSVLLEYVSDLLKVIPARKDSKDARFNSIVFNKHPVQSNNLVVMRTDAIRLMYYPIALESEWPFGCIVVPEDVMAWFSKLKKKKDKSVLIKIHEHALSLEYDDYRVVCLVDKQFLLVADFIKSDVDLVFIVSKEPFLKAVEYATIGDMNSAVTIKSENKELVISNWNDNESRSRRVNCVLEKDFEWSVKNKFLTSILQKCGDKVFVNQLLFSKDLYVITSSDKDFYYIVTSCRK
jgi:DNA polymerase III sliding clamp (beta) subunit (PCNA family)